MYTSLLGISRRRYKIAERTDVDDTYREYLGQHRDGDQLHVVQWAHQGIHTARSLEPYESAYRIST